MYATDFGWSRNFPIKKESDVHETLDIFLSRYGIPEALISDGARAYTGGRFRQKARDAGCFCKLTDPYSPWQNDIFLSRYRITEALISDGAKAYAGGRFRQKARDAGCFCKITDPYSPWQNRAEGESEKSNG
jgi:transposase InsO family protein